MSFAALLRHELVVIRPMETGEDDYGQAVTTDVEVAETRGLVQSLSFPNEVDQIGQAGPVVSDHKIFLPWGTDVSEADTIRFATDDGRRYEVNGLVDAGGQAHHLEVNVRLITGAALEEAS